MAKDFLLHTIEVGPVVVDVLRGATNDGPVSVEAHGGSVDLEKILGTVRVEGDDLEVSLEDIRHGAQVIGETRDLGTIELAPATPR